jgi:hypothetical protein
MTNSKLFPLKDRIGIFIDGQLSVVGTADELTASYGKGIEIVIYFILSY